MAGPHEGTEEGRCIKEKQGRLFGEGEPKSTLLAGQNAPNLSATTAAELGCTAIALAVSLKMFGEDVAKLALAGSPSASGDRTRATILVWAMWWTSSRLLWPLRAMMRPLPLGPTSLHSPNKTSKHAVTTVS